MGSGISYWNLGFAHQKLVLNALIMVLEFLAIYHLVTVLLHALCPLKGMTKYGKPRHPARYAMNSSDLESATAKCYEHDDKPTILNSRLHIMCVRCYGL